MNCMLVAAFPVKYNTNAGMLFLKVLSANIGFNQLFKYEGPAPPGEWNVLMLSSILNDGQITFAIINLQNIFYYFQVVAIYWWLVLTGFRHI